MVIGKLDKYITIEKPVYTTSSTTRQQERTSWTDYKSCWAKRVIDQSVEVVEEGLQVLKDTAKWTIRYYDAEDVKPDMRVLYESEYYYIKGIKELGRKDGWMLTTIKRDND
jgi:SPP1 family predicted phage head-tail adaptor